MDTSKRIGFLLITVFALCHAQDESKVELEFKPSGIIRQGDTVEITCRLHDAGLFDTNKIVRIYGGVSYIIAQNGELKDEYKSGYRLEAVQGDNPVAEAKLIIQDVTGDDSGKIGCSNGKQEAIEELIVHVPPHHVEIQYTVDGDLMSANHDHTIELMDGDDVTVLCAVMVEGSDVAPHVAVTLGDEDITSSLIETPSVVVQPETPNKKNGYVTRRYSATYSTEGSDVKMADRKYAGQSLTCTAHAEHFDPMSATVHIDVVYPPQEGENCPRTQYYKPGQDVLIQCEVVMNPTMDNWYWSWSGEDFDHTVASKDGDEYSELIKGGVEEMDGVYTFTLTVENVTEQYKHFTLFVHNSAGTTEIQINMESVAESTVIPSTTDTQEPDNEENSSDEDDEETGAVTDPHDSSASFSICLFTLVTCLFAAL